MYVCVCNSVTDSDIRAAVDGGVRTLKQLGHATGCGSTCGRCEEMAVSAIEQALAEKAETQNLLPMMQLA